ncbi:exodeoxyribonuclease V subunit beta [Rheinheimera sp.]|uniref:exodeoxyribonuclease V subunit beta n=1 Tax=Rheinheimera sp. TaxID=1869214 RepID=UPI0027B9C15C|nr:exodeoxyribonuclease V subunit beta [Rheinheimera sp.]
MMEPKVPQDVVMTDAIKQMAPAQPDASKMQRLDLLTLPLCGSALIEASAGTGKTYTIAALYLRAVLGHQPDLQHVQQLGPLLPTEILVVTFTEAATAELTERIRTRLSQAARYFRKEVKAADELLQALASSFPEAQWPQCAMRLELASQSMDEAAISTIHSWCQRMLAEHAFDSGSSFSEKLSADQSALFTEVVQDYWRSFVYALPQNGFFRYQQCYATPEQLLQALRVVWNDFCQADADSQQHHNGLAAAQTPAGLIAAEQQQRQQLLTALKAPFVAWVAELRLLFAKARQDKLINGSQLREDYLQNWLGALERWALDGELIRPELTESAWNRLSPQGIAQACKGEALTHPALVAIATLRTELDGLADCKEALRQHALRWCRQRFAKAQQQQGEFGFDDLLSRFAKALQGENGVVLAARVRAQFPLALIDEFQDTDPVQYQIFQQIYQPAQNRQDSVLLLIGDPKQAIYAFRGADIYTYLQAKQATAPRHYSLETNFRSSRAMVGAVNQLFLVAEQRQAGDGAFLFRPKQNLVAFAPVQAAGRTEWLTLQGKPMPALQICYLDENDKPLSKSSYLSQMALACANQICHLLNAGATEQAGFAYTGQHKLQGLQPADIAVLVNNQQEADEIRHALLQSGIRSVYLSDKGSVFQTAIARDLLLWLEACCEPAHELKLRSALAADSLNWRYSQLARLQQDEWFFAFWQDKFIAFHQLWRSQGVLPLVRRLLQDFGLISSFAGKKDGERQLTDLLHLAELLQQASRSLDGEMALLRYFKDHLAGEQVLDAEAMKLRLESDEALVRVVTIHKSKGLEYPLVFLPFIATARPLDPANLPYRYHDEQGQLQLCYQQDDTIFAKAEQERLGEDLRKLYVALTRARHYCWLGLAPLKDSSAIAYLLDATAQLTPGQLSQQLTQWQSEDIVISAWRDEPAAVFLASEQQEPLPEQPYARMSKRSYQPWWTASYSALAAGAGSEPGHSGSAGDVLGLEAAKNAELYQELSQEPLLPVASAGSEADTVLAAQALDISQQFLRGASAGSFLHDVLEWAAGQGFAEVAAEPALLLQHLISQSQKQHWLWQDNSSGRWHRRLLQSDSTELPEFASAEVAVADLACWIQQLIVAKWHCGGFLLSLDTLLQYQAELEFWFAATKVNTRQLDVLLRQYLWPQQERPALQQQQLNGMLKGFIDLTFSLDGRYYVADYKSNYLPSGQYSQEALVQLMLEKRYDLQAALYGLALHRLLTSRLPGYQIEQHLGDAYYWFVRGCALHQAQVQPEMKPEFNGMLCCPLPAALILALDTLFCGKAALEGTHNE